VVNLRRARLGCLGVARLMLVALAGVACTVHATGAAPTSSRVPSPGVPVASVVAAPSASPAAGSATASTASGDPGLVSVARLGLLQDLALSETHQGMTLTLRAAYADANRIAIGYSLQVPEALGLYHAVTANEQAVLTDEAGRFLPPYAVAGLGPGLDARITNSPTFDASRLSPSGGAHTFDLTLPTVRGVRPGGSSFETMAVGPWHFQFSLPVQPGAVLDQPQEVTASGSTVRLERAVIAPSSTRVWVRIAAPDGDASRRWSPIVQLDGLGYMSGGAQGSSETPPGSLLFDTLFATPPGPAGSTWTVQISELVGVALPTPGPAPQQRRVSGPWIFSLQIPTK